MNIFNKRKYIVYLGRKFNGTYHILRSVKLKNETAEIIRINKKRSFAIKLENPLFVSKNTTIYFYDIDTMTMISLIEVESHITPEDLDILINRKIVSQVASDLNESRFTIEMKNLILGSLVGAGIMGFVIMILLYLGVL